MSVINGLIKDIESNKMDISTLMKIAKKYNIQIKAKEDRLKDIIIQSSKNYIPYPTKKDEDFFSKIYHKKEFYENRYKNIDEEKYEDIQEKICPGPDKKFQLLPHQIVLRNYMNLTTPYNGVLVFHGLGSGKTCSSITIAENYRRSMMDNSSRKTLVLVSGDTIEENFRKEIHDIKKGYNQCTFTDYMNYKPFDSDKTKQDKVGQLIDKNYEIEHYQRLTNVVGNKKIELEEAEFKTWINHTYSNRVFIIDEIHNLKLIDKKEKDIKLKRYDAVMEILKYSSNIKLVLLSGTPMAHNVFEIVDVLNLLLINDKFPKLRIEDIFSKGDLTEEGSEKLKQVCRGYVSYMRKENPLTFPEKKYPTDSIKVSNFIENKFGLDLFENINLKDEFQIVPCKMKGKQMKTYSEFIKKTDTASNIQDLIQLQLVSYDFKDKKGLYKIPFDSFLESKVEDISAKFYKLIQNIKKSQGPIFIYTNYVESGVMLLASLMLKNGIDLNNSRKDEKSSPLFSTKFLQKRSRPSPSKQICAFCCLPRDKCEGKGHKFISMKFDFIIGNTQEDVQKSIIQKFNRDDNIQGQHLKIIIGSSVLKEGISLLKVRQLHVMEPWHNKSRIEQVIGRGLRHCSHKLLKPEDRNVEVFLYCAVLDKKFNYTADVDKNIIEKNMNEIFKNEHKKVPIEYAKPINGVPLLSFDTIMYKREEVLNYYIKKVVDILKRNAFDCALNREINIETLAEDEQYTCEGFSEDFDFKLGEREIDNSTYNNIFLTPYIKYVISLIKQHFETNDTLYEKDLLHHENLNDEIYKDDDFYIVKKALYTVVPKMDDMTKFPHTINYKNNYGYLFVRKIEDDNIYIFKKFENADMKRSAFELSPVYENKYVLKRDDEIPNSFKLFLSQIEKVELKKKGTDTYLSALMNVKSIKKTSKFKPTERVGNMAIDKIKKNNPKSQHKNDGMIVGIVIEDDIHMGNMWIRETEKNKDKKADSVQYSYAMDCGNYTHDDLDGFVRFLWNKVVKSSKFYKDFEETFEKFNKRERGMKNKVQKCDLLKKLFRYHEKNKTDKNTWFVEIN